MSKFTEGPWIVSKVAHSAVFNAKDRRFIAETCPPYSTHKFPREDVEANTRLIAAAPDLLRSLTWLADAAETEPGMQIYKAHIKLARETIAKATGEGENK